MSTKFKKYLRDNNFFLVSKELARLIAEAIEDEKVKDIELACAARTDEERAEIKELEESGELNLLPRIAIGREVVTDEYVEAFRHQCSASQVYAYLGFLADSEPEVDFSQTTVQQIFNYEFHKQWGLPADHPLISRHTEEFVQWLKDVKTFTTGWGAISFINDRLELVHNDSNSAVVINLQD
jgi:hypothetical protein